MNPVALTVAIAYISNPGAFPVQSLTAEGIQSAGDAFTAMKIADFARMDSDMHISSVINAFFLDIFNIKLPDGYVTLFAAAPSVITAFRYNILTLAASIVLISMNIIDWIVPLCYLAVYSICTYCFSLLPFFPNFYSGDILFALLTGGTLFIAFYILPDFSTAPRTRTGKIISGSLAGAAAFFICGPGASPVGGAFTVLLINAVNPFIEYFEDHVLIRTREAA
nr:RnfABCDGE type electron transport complex subunit D [Brucepastera parasyntrophica]